MSSNSATRNTPSAHSTDENDRLTHCPVTELSTGKSFMVSALAIVHSVQTGIYFLQLLAPSPNKAEKKIQKEHTHLLKRNVNLCQI